MNRDKESEIPEPTSLAFGFGRRSCPGSYLAVDTVWTTVAMTLATCTISPEVDAEGKAILPEVRYTSGAFRLVLLLLSLIGCLFKQLAAIRIHSPVEFSAVLEVSLSCL